MSDNFSNASPQYRDSVFRDYFNDKVRLLSLCNALLNTNYTDPQMLEINTLQGNFFSAQKNDISCRIGDHFLLLVEHQTSVNPNMPFRCLSYISQLLNNLVTDKDKRYQESLIMLPEPQCFVFYDGDEANEPVIKDLRLSDAFSHNSHRMELIVTSYNINYGLNQPLLQRCHYLNDYSILVGMVKQGLRRKLPRRQAIIQAVDWCIANNIMTDYLTPKKSEVFTMLDFQWNIEEAKVAWHQQGFNEGLNEGRAEGLTEGRLEGLAEGREQTAINLINLDISIDKIQAATNLSLEHIQKLARQIGKL